MRIKEDQERPKTLLLLLELNSLLQEHFGTHRGAMISLTTMVTTRRHESPQNNQVGDLAAVLAEMMRKRHEEDLAHHVGTLDRVREENERLRQKINREERERTRREDRTEDEGSRQEDRGGGDASHSTLVNSSRRHPFTDDIMATELPANWKCSTLDRCDGLTDPDEHIDVYVAQLSLYTTDDNIFYKFFFSTSLKGAALTWFT